jgi:hypothetical protein
MEKGGIMCKKPDSLKGSTLGVRKMYAPLGKGNDLSTTIMPITLSWN